MDNNSRTRLSDPARGALLAAGGITIVSPDALLVRLISANSLVITFWRGLLSSLVLLSWLTVSKRQGLLAAFRAVGKIGLAAAVLHAIGPMLFISAIKLTATANVLVILAAEPLFAAILSAALLKERVPRNAWIAATVVLVGLAIVFWGGYSRGSTLGDLLAFGAMACISARYVLFRAAKNVDMLPSVVMGSALTVIVLLPIANPFDVSAQDLWLLVIMAAILLPLGQMMLVAAPRYISAPDVTLIVLLEIVMGPAWVWLVLGEVPPGETVLGGMLIIGTLAVYLLHSRRRS